MENKDFEVLHYKNTIIETINHLLDERDWSLKRLCTEADIPYDTMKKIMSRKISSPTIYTLIKISDALNCSLDFLVGRDGYHNINFPNMPARTYTLLSEIAHFEACLNDLNESGDTYYIPVIVPTGNMGDQMIYESMYTDYIDASSYREKFGDIMMCGLKITNKALHPTFLEGDILLIAKDRHPNYGETGIFLKNNRVYIRKYLCGSPSILEPVNGMGNAIVVDNPHEWNVFGRVLTIIRK